MNSRNPVDEVKMSDSYTNLLYHIVFSTKERRPLITSEYEARLYDYIGGTIRGVGGISLELNGTEDHVHVLAKLAPRSRFVGRTSGSQSQCDWMDA
jgi:REP element-mobilizing transposase RayT